MSAVELFEFCGDQLRVEMIDGEPWFVAQDIAIILEYSATSAMTRRLSEDDKGVRDLHTPGGVQSFTIISEAGLYVAIFGSQAAGAQQFKRKVTHEILPQIRKTGGYGQPAPVAELDRRQLALMVIEAEDAREKAEQRAVEMQPKADYVDRFVGQSSDAITVDVFASQFGTTGPKVRDLMVEKNIAVRKCLGERWSNSKQRMEKVYEWRPRQGVRSSDWFDLRPQHNAPRHHNGQVKQTMYVLQFHAQELADALGLGEVA